MGESCCDGVCGKCWSLKYILVGLIFILVTLFTELNIWIVIGILLVIKGVVKLAMPNGCGHCRTESTPSKKGKK